MATGERTAWTSVNIAEAMPGVQTPLGWTFWRDACERGIRKAFWRMGAFTAGEVQSPVSADDRFFAVFHGRVAGNVLRFRDLGDRLPGTSGDAVEEQIFGVRRTAELSRPHWRRYPVAAVKFIFVQHKDGHWRFPQGQPRIPLQYLLRAMKDT